MTAIMVEVVHNGGAGKLTEFAAKRVLVEKKFSFKMRKRDFFGKMILDVAQDVLDACMEFGIGREGNGRTAVVFGKMQQDGQKQIMPLCIRKGKCVIFGSGSQGTKFVKEGRIGDG